MADHGKRARQERALDRLQAALDDPRHEWKNQDGPQKAATVRTNLLAKGVQPT